MDFLKTCVLCKQFFDVINQYALTQTASHLYFRTILKVSTIFNFCQFFFHFRWSDLMLKGFLCSSRRLRVKNVSFVAQLGLGKNFAHQKRMVNHISNLNFSDKKCKLETGGKPSTWFPPGTLVGLFRRRSFRINSDAYLLFFTFLHFCFQSLFFFQFSAI